MNDNLILKIQQKKHDNDKIIMLTAYSYTFASIINKGGIDMVLVGDSLAQAEYGYDDTRSVTMDDMVRHVAAVARAVDSAPVVADMPYGSFHVSAGDTLNNAKRFMQVGATAVKIEWHKNDIEMITSVIEAGIPVMGHVGLTPQTASELGGFKVQGKTPEQAQGVIDNAKRLESAGAFSIVLECIPAQLAGKITASLKIPTIGIGAGPDCDGQVLVSYDLLGMFTKFRPRFVKSYVKLDEQIIDAVKRFTEEVKNGTFPDKPHSFC